MRILVTGSCGLVGSEAVKFFTEKGFDVTGVDNNMRSYFFGTPKKTPQVTLDLRNQTDVYDLIQRGNFDAIIHTAAQPSHDWAKNDPLMDFDVNARATLLLLEACRQYSPNTIFVHCSTDKVYGENMQGEKLSDESLGLDFAGKRSLFGCSKTAADIYVQEYGNYFGMKTVCFRAGCITGRNHEGAEYHGFLAYVAKCVREGKEYTIFNDAVRDQIHAYDLLTAMWEFIQNPKSGAVYNIGGGLERAVSVNGALAMCIQETDNDLKIHTGEKRLGDRDYDVHDVSKFKADYPKWKYKYSLKDIISELCA